MKEKNNTSVGMMKNNRIPVFGWNGQASGQVSLTRLYKIIDNHKLGKSTRVYDWGCLSGSQDIISLEESRLPMIQIPKGMIGLRVDVVNNVYRCRLQINHAIESIPYILGHFRPYKSNHLVVLVHNKVELNQVIQDLEETMVIVDHNPIGSDEMIKLTSDPYSWFREHTKTLALSS